MAAGKSRAKITYQVGCQIHGTPSKVVNNYKVVKVAQPSGKKERLHGGCPYCKSEQA